MAAAVQINNVDAASQSIYVTGFIVLTGNYPIGGDPLNFATATPDPSFIGLLAGIEGAALLQIDVWSMNAASINGANSVSYTAVCTKTGSPAMINPSSGVKLKVGALSSTPTTEHAAAAYEAQYTGDLIAFMAVFTKMI